MLKLLNLIPSPESIDFVQEKMPYQLHALPTEQRHPRTWNLSDRIEEDLEAGLRLLLTVDEDIGARLEAFPRDIRVFELAVQSVEEAILSERNIYVFGCEETGRWAKWLESSIWRPFWKNLREKKRIWEKVGPAVSDSIENRLIGEMPGGDMSLIVPPKGWQDHMLTGRLQLEERGIEPGDVVFCISASGETPAVIGAIYEALDRWTRRYPYDAEKIQKKLFYICNNPPAALLPFDRCRAVLEEPGITKIDCTTGHQAIAGSTRMQASTIDAFLLAHILQAGVDRALRRFLSDKDMAKLGFEPQLLLAEELEGFGTILRAAKRAIPSLSKLTAHAEKAGREDRHVTYMAIRGSGTVFNDCAEQGPAFHSWPLDPIKTDQRKSRIQVWLPSLDAESAWASILGRPFRGLSLPAYKSRLEQGTGDSDLLRVLREGSENRGDGQQFLYDFSFSDFNIQERGPEKGDMGVLVIISPEEEYLTKKDSPVFRFMTQFLEKGAHTAVLFVTGKSEREATRIVRKIPGFDPEGKDVLAILPIDPSRDPMGIDRLIALKIVLNAHSTALMARAGSVIGNTVTVEDFPLDPRSIGRATALVLSHVNDVLKKPEWVKRHGLQKPISYGEGNAVLYDAIRFVESEGQGTDRRSFVALSIIRILESLRLNRSSSLEEALAIVRESGLRRYLKDVASQIN